LGETGFVSEKLVNDCLKVKGLGGGKYWDILPRTSLDGPLNRQPDHIEEINKLVDDVFGKHDDAVNAAKKVELPGKWKAKNQWISFPGGRELATPHEYVAGVVCKQRNADLDAAREYWFRAGVEAAAEVSAKSVFPYGIDAAHAIAAQIRAIHTPSVD
jgi:hypothetical protein